MYICIILHMNMKTFYNKYITKLFHVSKSQFIFIFINCYQYIINITKIHVKIQENTTAQPKIEKIAKKKKKNHNLIYIV